MNPEQVLTLDKGKIRTFATESRVKLREHVEDRLRQYGVTAEEIKKPLPSSTPDTVFIDIGSTQAKAITGAEIAQRRRLVEELVRRTKELSLKDAVEELIDEVAYTWFNRLIAIRFMEVNEYLHNKEGNNHRLRILSSSDPNRSHMSTDIMDHPFDAGFSFTEEEEERIHQYQASHELEALFRLLFLKQCNELSGTLGFLFDSADGGDSYQELLFNIPYTMKGGIIRELIDNIPQVYFDVSQGGQIEIIGWLYQYYNSEVKDEVFGRPASQKIQKHDIPAATQLFTPQWIVQYMVQNSLGRLWTNAHPESQLAEDWDYYLAEAEQTGEVQAKLEEIRNGYRNIDPRQITLIDPAMGSGHILVYAFEMLMDMYRGFGYRERDAAVHIVNENLFGLEIDDRAHQLALFAVLMKAREYDRRIFSRELSPNLYAIPESNLLNQQHLQIIKEKSTAYKKQIDYIITLFDDAKEYGSILKIEEAIDYDALKSHLKALHFDKQMSLGDTGIEETRNQLIQHLDTAKALDSKYHIVVTNPPYMGSRGMNPKLTKYLREYYPDSRSDLFAVFIEQCQFLTKPDFYTAMITQHAWMFLKSYEKLREVIVRKDITSMAHLGARAFDDIGGEVVQTTTFIIQNINVKERLGSYVRLVDINGELQKRDAYVKAINDPNSNLLYHTTTENFTKIPGMPIAYWIKDSILNAFTIGKEVEEYGLIRQGIATGNNQIFLKLWHEVYFNTIAFGKSEEKKFELSGKKYAPYNKGGGYRRWYGNLDYIIWYDKEAIKKLENSGNKLPSRALYFLKSITWSDISSTSFAARACDQGSLFDVKGSSAFTKKEEYYYPLLALLNSKLTLMFIQILNPTITTQVGDLKRIPFISKNINYHVADLSQQCVNITRIDWDSFETSWDFKKHPMLTDTTLAETAYNQWRDFTAEQFAQLHANEEELNRIFIEIYGLEDELTPEVDPKDVTITKIVDDKKDKIAGNAYSMDKKEAIETFISYAVGCMFGRYSLDEEGLAFAGGQWDSSKYKTYQPVEDNIILITETDTGQKDIVRLFVEFVETVYGKENLEQNLKFIADSLGKRGSSSQEKIRAYFYDDFYKDHTQRYQRTPIYWQFDSGRQGGFRALMYLHRYEKDTLGKARLNFLHPLQTAYESVISTNESIVSHSSDTREINQRKKENEGLSKKLTECREYDANLGHLAPLGIELDLDDGVEVNHEKVQTDREGKVYKILTNRRG